MTKTQPKIRFQITIGLRTYGSLGTFENKPLIVVAECEEEARALVIRHWCASGYETDGRTIVRRLP